MSKAVFDDAESTVMSILQGVAADQHSRRQLSLERFCVTYTQPLVNFLVRAKGLADDDAMDLVQDFWLSKMLQPSPDANLVARYLVAQQTYDHASFRSYLSVALNNFLRSRYRSAGEAMRRTQVSVEQLEGWEAESPEDLNQFDTAWANHILAIVLDRVRLECDSTKLRIKWTVFVRLILQPLASNQPRPSYASLAAELGLPSAKEIGTSLTTFKRIFMRHLQFAVQDYLPANSREESIAAAQTEVATILAKLSRIGGLELPLADWGVTILDDKSDYGLVLNNLTPANLIRSDKDYQTAWNCLLAANLHEALGIWAGDSKQVTVKEIISGGIQDVKVLNQIRSGAKKLGSLGVDNGSNESPLNAKLYGLIYLVAIAGAKLSVNQDISTQPLLHLLSLCKSFANEKWIDEPTKLLLLRYKALIDSGSK